MPANQVVEMIWDTLGVMVIGVPSVFAVLGVFYLSIRGMMAFGNRDKKKA